MKRYLQVIKHQLLNIRLLVKVYEDLKGTSIAIKLRVLAPSNAINFKIAIAVILSEAKNLTQTT